MLRDLVAGHPGFYHVFYLNVPLEETLRRHEGRPMRKDVEPDKLRQWYVPHDVLGLAGEAVLDGTADVDTTLAEMLARIGPVPARPERDGARFL